MEVDVRISPNLLNCRPTGLVDQRRRPGVFGRYGGFTTGGLFHGRFFFQRCVWFRGRRKFPFWMVNTAPEPRVGQPSDPMVFFVDGVPWFFDQATGEHWRDTNSDSVMSETEVEEEILEEITAPENEGTARAETDILETEADVLVAAQELINAGVRWSSFSSSVPLIVPCRDPRNLANLHLP